MEDKTLYEMILDKLGVEEGEKFNVSTDLVGSIIVNPYHFNDGFFIDRTGEVDDNLFIDLLMGKATIEKMPWKPNFMDYVFFIDNKSEKVYQTMFSNIPSDLAMLKCEWFFKSYKEAEANKERVLKEMGEVLEQ